MRIVKRIVSTGRRRDVVTYGQRDIIQSLDAFRKTALTRRIMLGYCSSDQPRGQGGGVENYLIVARA